MERELPPYRAAVTKPARPSIWPTMVIGAVLATVIGGGVYLLGQTRAKWEANRTERTQRLETFEREWQQGQTKPVDQPTTPPLQRQPMRNPNLRCINGQLFRKLPNGWENIPGESC